MPLPIDITDDQGYGGIRRIDNLMNQDIADQQRDQWNPSFEGYGMNGLAVRLNNGHIGKYTTDKNEVDIASYQISNNISCLVNIYEIHTINDELWMIEMELLKTLNETEMKIIDDVLMSLELLIDTSENIENLNEDTYQMLVDRAPSQPVFGKYLQLYRCLMDNGFSQADIHPGNIGYDDTGKLKLFDLGFTYL